MGQTLSLSLSLADWLEVPHGPGILICQILTIEFASRSLEPDSNKGNMPQPLRQMV